MKFKAILTDQIFMKDFFNIVATFARLSKRATFNVKKTGLLMSNVGTSINTNPTVWTVIGKDDFFAQFNMEGVDAEHNEIWLSFYPEQLATALNTLKNFVKVIKMKLTKKQFPCLTIDIEMAPPNSNTFRRLVHDVPVTIITTREWNEYQVPAIQNYDISIQMPSLKSLRTLCDKMKNLAATLTVCCASTSDLSFIVETDSAMVVSRYFNLILEQIANSDDRNGKDDANLEMCCQIDSKQLATCFGSIQLLNTPMVGNMMRDELFNIRMNIRENVQMFFNIQCVDVT